MEVQGTPVTGCECTVDKATPDVKDGPVTVTWKVSECKAGTAAADIGTYAWTGATSTTATATATVSAKGDTKTASVKVTSTENASMNVTCPQVKAVNSDIPDYIWDEDNKEVKFPQAGSYVLVSDRASDWHQNQGTTCTVYCTVSGGNESVTVTIDGLELSGSNYVQKSGLSIAHTIGKTAMNVEFEAPSGYSVTCGLNW